jgi:basic membrane lipoprotein Med (substrate-binding protein (PBP1-ABC) superfamily)
MEDTWTSGHIELGIKQGGVDISPMTYTGELRNGSYVFNGVNKSRWEHVQDISTKIKNGDIVVDDELIEEAATPGFEWIAILILFGLAAIQIRRRR